MDSRIVVVLGGYGTYGRLISAHLASQTDIRLIVAGRDASRGAAYASAIGARFVQCDVTDPVSLGHALAKAFLVVNASGPFQSANYAIPEACIAMGAHYIDLGDGRDYVSGVTQLHARACEQGVFVCLGASTTPAVTSAGVMAIRPQRERVRSIRIALNAGNKNQAGASTIASILAYVGSPVRVWHGGRWRQLSGWGEGEFVDFPDPVGRRRVQLCDVPDLELFPAMFEADDVIFKAGVELTVLNYAIGAVGLTRKLAPRANLPALAPLLVRLSGWFKPYGTLHGSVGVWVTDMQGRERSLAFVAPSNGPQLPASPVVLLARKVLSGEVTQPGAYPCVGFLSVDDFVAHLAPFGIFVVRGAVS